MIDEFLEGRIEVQVLLPAANGEYIDRDELRAAAEDHPDVRYSVAGREHSPRS